VAENTLEAITVEESRIALRENTITQNGSGITLSSTEGLVSQNRISKNMNYGISLTGSRIKVSNNEIMQNRVVGIRVADGKSIAWGNAIAANGQYDLYKAGAENFMAIGNWWGDVKVQDVPRRIYPGSGSLPGGKVHYLPVLERKPEISL
jgi:parallel beta-helix repeat protein